MRNFLDVKILVLGDIIIDRYIMGTSDRISPEAPVPVIKFEKEKLVCGGAANVAKNIEGLGAEVRLCGFIGDSYGSFICDSFYNISGILYWEKPTIVKTRVIANGQQVARIDKEDTEINLLSDKEAYRLKEYLCSVISKFDLVIISDYAKGTVNKDIVDFIKTFDKKVIVDPKPQNIEYYKFVETIMPNKKEAEEIVGRKLRLNAPFSEESTASFLKDLKSYTECNNVVVTLGNEGLIYYTKERYFKIPSTNQKVFDVTGAGDTLIAAYSTALASGFSHYSSLKFASKVAGIVVGKPGTYAIQIEDRGII